MDIKKIYKNTTIISVLMGLLLLACVSGYVIYISPSVHLMGLFENNGSEIEVIASGSAEAVIENATEGEPVPDDTVPVESEEISLTFSGKNSSSEYLWIPITETASAADVVIENHYMDRQLWISINGGDLDYYRTNSVSGNVDGIVYGGASSGEEQVTLKFTVDHVYEYNTIFEDNVLYIEKVSPRELYDKIAIIDPASMEYESDKSENTLSPAKICLDIGMRVKENLEAEGIHVYVTRMDDRVLPDEEVILLSSEVKPDILVRVETSFDDDSKVFGTKTVYNGTYFIPGFGSVELADMLEASVTTKIGGYADGLVDATEDDVVIKNATVPAASVKVGYFTNAQENILLNREDYRTKIADGMTEAILEAFNR